MAPTPRAQKKRKTDTSATAVSTTKPTPPAAATNSKPADEDKDSETGGVALPTPDSDNDDEKYASAESSSDEEGVNEYSLASESSADDSDDSISSLVAAQTQQNKKKRKRNDPEAFSTSMSKILSSHLTTAARKDPVLVRAKQNTDHVDDGKLEAKARRILKEEMRKEKEKGRLRDLVPKDGDAAAGKALEKERALKAIARSGVAKLYNAVRAAQIKGEEAAKGAKKEGVVGMGNRETKVTEMSKQGFLDLIQSAAK
ncbi:Rrp15p-domain-containing protein [Trichophaea hybrida]|nr:Rrp15p-domain-containing protein [Trichophaea hybrida]